MDHRRKNGGGPWLDEEGRMLWIRAQAPTTGEGEGCTKDLGEAGVVAGDPSIDFRTQGSRSFIRKRGQLRGAQKEEPEEGAQEGVTRTPEETRRSDQARADGIRQAVQERWVRGSGARQEDEVMKGAEAHGQKVDLEEGAGIQDPAARKEDFVEVPDSAERGKEKAVRW